jgi:hypothetical protein
MLRCGNSVISTVRFLHMAKLTTQTPISFLISWNSFRFNIPSKGHNWPSIQIILHHCRRSILLWATIKFDRNKTKVPTCRISRYLNPTIDSETFWTHSTNNQFAGNTLTCRIWGFHGSGYEECRLLGCDAVWVIVTWRFERKCRVHLQGRRNTRDRKCVKR